MSGLAVAGHPALVCKRYTGWSWHARRFGKIGSFQTDGESMEVRRCLLGWSLPQSNLDQTGRMEDY
jgi:hypothetical protein